MTAIYGGVLIATSHSIDSAVVTVGTGTSPNDTFWGYSSGSFAFGSISDATFDPLGETINKLYWYTDDSGEGGAVNFGLVDNSGPFPQDWISMTINGTKLYREDAANYNGVYFYWVFRDNGNAIANLFGTTVGAQVEVVWK